MNMDMGLAGKFFAITICIVLIYVPAFRATLKIDQKSKVDQNQFKLDT